jgi:DNA-directed RNA polymerase specialized sigma24 family protein
VDPIAFGKAWSRVEPRLFKQLVVRRGLAEEQAADLCQEVALRAFVSRVQFRTATELFRWAAVVGNRLATVLLTEQAPSPLEGEVAGAAGFEEQIETRWALQVALCEATDADLNALRRVFEDSPAPAGKRERDRLALQLHRARKRLRARLDELLGGVAIGLDRLRLRTRLEDVPRGPIVAALAAVAAGAVMGSFNVLSAETPDQVPGLGTSETRSVPTNNLLTGSVAQVGRGIAQPSPASKDRPEVRSGAPPQIARPIDIRLETGTVGVTTRADTPAGTTHDSTMVQVNCEWWIMRTVCPALPALPNS